MMKLRYPAECSVCGVALPAGAPGGWDPATPERGTSTAARATPAFTDSAPQARALFEPGHPGASVEREYLRRKRKREARTRDAHPRIGGLLLALRRPPQHELAFHQGQLGEQKVAISLQKRTAAGPATLLHDRRMPAGRGNIDHLAIAPNGVFVIDAKNIKGKVRVSKPARGAAKLLINGYNRTKLIDGLDRQLCAVSDALIAVGHPDASPIQGVLCFTDADLPLLGTLQMRGHLLIHTRTLAKRLNAPGPLPASTIDTLARALARALPPA